MTGTWPDNAPKSPSSPAYERIVKEAPMTPAQEDVVTWLGWNPKVGYAWETRSDTQQGAVSALLRSGRCAGNHGWEVRGLGVVSPEKRS